MKKFLFYFWVLVCAPGYLQLWFQYNFPIEWGKKRSVAESARKWKNRHWFAPGIALVWYILLIIIAAGGMQPSS